MKYLICLLAPLLVLSGNQRADSRYAQAVRYIYSDTTLLSTVQGMLRTKTADSTVVLMISDTLINLPLFASDVMGLKYGLSTSDSTYKSRVLEEHARIREQRSLYSPEVVPELQDLSTTVNANAVLFFSIPYENILVAQIFPENIEIYINSREKSHQHDTTPVVENISVVSTFYKRMRRQNECLQIIFLFNQDGMLDTAHYYAIKYE